MSANAATATSLADELGKHVKTYATRKPNWQVFGFETQLDRRYGRAQRRYLGTSGNVDHSDPTALMGEHFTLTIITMPPGHVQPMHHHLDAEEVLFVLEGSPTIVWERDGETVARELGRWDMVYNPTGIAHGIRNDGDRECSFQVMLGNPTPARPNYQEPALARLQASDNSDLANRQ